MRQSILFGLKVLVSIALLAYLLQTIDLQGFELEGIKPGLLTAAMALLVLQIIVNAYRWYRVLMLAAPDNPPSYKNVFRIYYASMFFNLFMPSTIAGDTYRSAMSAALHMEMAQCLKSVLIERLWLLSGLIAMLMLSLPLLLPYLPTRVAWLEGEIAFLVVIIFFLGFNAMLVRFNIFQFMNFPAPKTQLSFLSHAMLPHLLTIVAVYLAVLSVNLDITLVHCFTFLPLIFAVIMMPVTVGGWGVRELTMVGLFGLAGIADEQSLLLGILFGVISILSSLPGLICWWSIRPTSESLV